MRISIITVCYNSSQYIRSAIDSVLSQSYTDIEYIVIDGGSTDETLEIINEYMDQISLIISEVDEGMYDAMNKGIALASGDIIGILNSDDFYSNINVISDVVGCFNTKDGIDMIFGNVDFVNAQDLNSPLRLYSSSRFSPWKLRFGFMPAHPASFIKKSAYNGVGSYKLGYNIAADFDMFVRLLLGAKKKYYSLNKVMVRMRLGGVSTSGVNSYIVSSQEMMRSLKENNIFTCWLFICIRLPIKLVQSLSFKITSFLTKKANL
ncbi:MAG: glycosyltransferase [Methylococcaceae bacterium]|nr:glycosyltransferase [Methylococcaceae bacterium]